MPASTDRRCRSRENRGVHGDEMRPIVGDKSAPTFPASAPPDQLEPAALELPPSCFSFKSLSALSIRCCAMMPSAALRSLRDALYLARHHEPAPVSDTALSRPGRSWVCAIT